MIETLCGCGSVVCAEEAAIGTSVQCGACKIGVKLVSAEPMAAGTGIGDFDARFIVEVGPIGVGNAIAVGGVSDIQLGKADGSHVVLVGPSVSRSHAKLVRIDFGPSRWKVLDTASRNGVFVNGEQVSEADLISGDIVNIGEFQLRYLVGTPPLRVPVPLIGSIVCPGCQTSYKPATKFCIDCGIDLKTGRPLVTSKDIDENDIAIRADTWIRIISLFIWFGLFPIASEAFATHKPRATWIITGITVLCSVVFFVAGIGSPMHVAPSMRNAMLWVGQQGSPDQLIAVRQRAAERDINDEVRRFKAKDDDKNGIRPGWEYVARDRELEIQRQRILAAQKRQIADAVAAEGQFGGEFHVYQLFTNTLLHSGIIHLAGNLLFLLVFGLRINELIGDLKMAIVYPLLGVLASGVYALAEWNQPLRPAIGASGAIMGLAGMYLVFFPVHRVHMAFWFRGGLLTGWRVYYKLFRMKGFWLLGLWILFNDVLPTLLSWINPRNGVGDHVAHWAHLGGFVCGMLIAFGLLFTRQVNAHGADVLSVTMGAKAWALIGKPTNRRIAVDGG